MDAKYCKYCGKELNRHEKERCMECFLKLDNGKCYPPKWWDTHLP